MKRILFFYTLSFIFFNSFAQAPEKMTYQAIIRDAGNNVLASTNIGMKISILKGSAVGSVVYTETQSPTTNINGLVTIVIGDGSGFAINWSNDIYFIKTETDPAGGTNYTITGTMQLLSVPYALHAKTANTVTAISINNLTDAKSNTALSSYYIGHNSGNNANNAASSNTAIGYYSGYNFDTGDKNTAIGSDAGPANGTLHHTTALGYNARATANHQVVLGTETDTIIIPNTLRIKTQLNPPAGNVGQLYVETGDNNLYYHNGNNWQSLNHRYSVGDWAMGGVVFWVDETGQHGLICAIVDADEPIRYSAHLTQVFARGNGIYAGEMNTSITVATQVPNGSPFAALSCANFDSETIIWDTNYGDWYLPSHGELLEMYNNRNTINTTIANNQGTAIPTLLYWSSTEDASTNKMSAISFSDGTTSLELKTTVLAVRAIRRF